MSVMQQMIEQATRLKAEESAAQDAARAEGERADAARIAERRDRLISWLGPLAEEMTVSAGERDRQGRDILDFRMMPRAWRMSNMHIGVMDRGNERGVYELSLVISGQRVSIWPVADAAGDRMAGCLLAAQRAYDAALAKREKEESALFDWRRLLMAYREERDEAVAHNAAVREKLRRFLGDVHQYVREVEYAVVTDSHEYAGAALETRVAWVVGNIVDTDTFMVIEDGRGRVWTFCHVARVSDPVAVWPSERPELFATERMGGETVFYLPWNPEHKAAVDVAVADLRPYPKEPSWSDLRGDAWASMPVAARNILIEVVEAAAGAMPF